MWEEVGEGLGGGRDESGEGEECGRWGGCGALQRTQVVSHGGRGSDQGEEVMESTGTSKHEQKAKAWEAADGVQVCGEATEDMRLHPVRCTASC